MVSFFRFLIAISMVILISLSCTTKDGDILNPPVETHQLWVKSAGTDSAMIFMDHKYTGQKTPALIQNISDEMHVFHVFAANYKNQQDSILVSDFTGLDSLIFNLTANPGGDLIVRSDPDSARIFINSLEFGQTPLTVQGLQAGNYRIKLLKSNFDPVYRDVAITANDSANLVVQLQKDLRNIAILEHFSNSGCVPCVPVEELVDELITEYPVNEVVFLGYHANSPDPGDPMYLASKPIVDARFGYYNALFTPRSYMNGELIANPRDKTLYTTAIQQQLEGDTLATIAFQQVNRGQNELSGVLKVEALADLPAECKIHILLIEDDVNFPSAPGINGLTHFAYVARDFFSDVNGLDCQLTNMESKIFSFAFADISRWGSDLTVIAFLQDNGNQKILQAGWTKYPAF